MKLELLVHIPQHVKDFYSLLNELLKKPFNANDVTIYASGFKVSIVSKDLEMIYSLIQKNDMEIKIFHNMMESENRTIQTITFIDKESLTKRTVVGNSIPDCGVFDVAFRSYQLISD